jgi:hypothetical protein
MRKKFFYSTFLIFLLAVTSSVLAGLEPFSIPPVQDAYVSNDTQEGPDTVHSDVDGIHIRNVSGRRRVGYLKFDISELKGESGILADVSFSIDGWDAGDVEVYGVIEDLDSIDVNSLTWNTAPGVMNNPTPALDSPVELDLADLVGPLMTFQVVRRTRESTETSQDLTDFLNSDEDGIAVLLFAPVEEGDSGIILSIEETPVGEHGTLLEGMFVPPIEALGPNPADGQIDVPRDVVLSWRPGRYADTHNVYFGTDANDINEASLTDPRKVLLQQKHDDLSYILPDELELESTYYWRIDEVNDLESGSPFKGHVWSFTTGNFLVIDDFEDYGDYPPNEVWNTWLDGYGDPTNGSTAGYDNPDFVAGEHYLEDEIVYGGDWSMPLVYDNSAGISEVTRTPPITDWTQEGMVALGLWYYGDAANAAEPIYIVVNNTVITNDDLNAALVTEWTDWNIELQTLTDQGVNLSNVNSITLGFGNKSNPTTGGTGTVFFDNLRLYRQRCVPSMAKPEYDLNDDCVVNQADLDLLNTEYGRSLVTAEDVAGVYREAESADSISAPMMIYDDATASGGQYITVESGTGSSSTPPSTGVASYNITVDAGTYRIFAKTIAPDGSSDSLWLRIQGTTTQVAINESGWVNWRVMPTSTDWRWVSVVSSDAGDATVQFTMNAGNYTVEIGYREDSFLDCFMLIDDPEFQISDLDPLLYDLNGDGTTDDADVALLMEQWLDEILWP